MSEIDTLREMRPAPPPAELEAMRMAARERFVARTAPRRARKPWRLPVLAGRLTAGAAASAAVALVLTSGPEAAVPVQHGTPGHARTVVTAAWTVREAADGTVTIDVRQYADPGVLQRTLRADGVNAIVRQIPSVPLTFGKLTIAWPTCNYAATDIASQAVQQAVWRAVFTAGGHVLLPVRFIIHPEAMAPGSALFLTFLTGMPPNATNGNTGILALKPFVLDNDTAPACVPRKKPLPATLPASGSQLSPAGNP
jgi:hypothetical protein